MTTNPKRTHRDDQRDDRRKADRRAKKAGRDRMHTGTHDRTRKGRRR